MNQNRASILLERFEDLTEAAETNDSRMRQAIYTSVASGVFALSDVDFELPKALVLAACAVSIGSAVLAVGFRENRTAAEETRNQLR